MFINAQSPLKNSDPTKHSDPTLSSVTNSTNPGLPGGNTTEAVIFPVTPAQSAAEPSSVSQPTQPASLPPAPQPSLPTPPTPTPEAKTSTANVPNSNQSKKSGVKKWLPIGILILVLVTFAGYQQLNSGGQTLEPSSDSRTTTLPPTDTNAGDQENRQGTQLPTDQEDTTQAPQAEIGSLLNGSDTAAGSDASLDAYFEEYERIVAEIEQLNQKLDTGYQGENQGESQAGQQNDYSTGSDTSESLPSDAPPAPLGFSWYTCQNNGSILLKPDGWYTKEEGAGDTKACFITRESIDTGSFTTGLSLNALPNVTLASGQSAVSLARDLMETYAELPQIISAEPIRTLSAGPFTGYARTVQSADATFYYLHYANPSTDSLFIVSFESPTSKWSTDWSLYGTPMLEQLGLDPSF